MDTQQITKILNYFRINHNFHTPYNFIVDGNFLKILIQKGLDLQQKLKAIVQGKYKVKVTGCTVGELQMLGNDFMIIAKKAKQMQHSKCQHSFLPVDQCILDHARTEKSLIVCSQDKVLRRKLRNKNVGIMYFGPDQRITMEDIERHALQNNQQSQREKFMPTHNERQQLQEFQEQQQTLQKLKQRRNQFKMAASQGIQLKYLKKKVIKGPNPLSMRKKKQIFQNKQTVQSKQPAIHKQKRIRKRNKNKDKNTQN